MTKFSEPKLGSAHGIIIENPANSALMRCAVACLRAFVFRRPHFVKVEMVERLTHRPAQCDVVGEIDFVMLEYRVDLD